MRACSDSDSDVDYLEPGTPSMTVSMDLGTFEAADGHWLGSSTSSIVGEQEDGELVFQVDLDGDIRDDGTFAVSEMRYSDSVAAGDWDFYYTGLGVGAADLEVIGHDVDGDYIWATWEGSLTLTDSVGGGTATVTSVTVESWPRFGTK